MDPDLYRESIRLLHTEAVSASITALDPNRILGTPPPPIDPEEASLPRAYCSALVSPLRWEITVFVLVGSPPQPALTAGIPPRRWLTC